MARRWFWKRRTRAVPRIALIIVSAVLLAGAPALFLIGQPGPAACVVTLEAGLVLAAIVFERRRYKAVLDAPPTGEGWAMTDERFIDPETEVETVVWFNARSGTRAYVRAG